VARGLSGKWQGACQGSGKGLVREVAEGVSEEHILQHMNRLSFL